MIKEFLKHIIPIVCLAAFLQGWAADTISSGDGSSVDASAKESVKVEEIVTEANSFPLFDTIITYSRPASLLNAPQRQNNGQRRIDTWFRYSFLPVKVVKHNYCREDIRNILNLKFLALSEPSDRLALLGKFVI